MTRYEVYDYRTLDALYVFFKVVIFVLTTDVYVVLILELY